MKAASELPCFYSVTNYISNGNTTSHLCAALCNYSLIFPGQRGPHPPLQLYMRRLAQYYTFIKYLVTNLKVSSWSLQRILRLPAIISVPWLQ